MNKEDDKKQEPACCPHCGSVEFDLIKWERGHEGRGWFNRCYRCEVEWEDES